MGREWHERRRTEAVWVHLRCLRQPRDWFSLVTLLLRKSETNLGVPMGAPSNLIPWLLERGKPWPRGKGSLWLCFGQCRTDLDLLMKAPLGGPSDSIIRIALARASCCLMRVPSSWIQKLPFRSASSWILSVTGLRIKASPRLPSSHPAGSQLSS